MLDADEFVRFVALVHAARAADDGGDAGGVEQAAFGAENHGAEVSRAAECRDQLGRFAVCVGGKARVGRQLAEADFTLLAHRPHARQHLLFGVGLERLRHFVRVLCRQGADLEVEAAVGGDDVQCLAASDHPGLHRGEGRVEACVVPFRRLETLADPAQFADQFGGVFDGVDPLRRIGRVAGMPVDVATHRQFALVPQHRFQLGGFADDAQQRLDRPLLQFGQ
ncbi:hypothetical protein D3C73_1106630 [compost metagenome]